MKNFKLLLATTAVLSMGFAMGVNATFPGESTTVQTKVEILKARSLSNPTPLDFGRIVIDDTTRLEVNMDSSGNMTLLTSGAYILTQGTKGVVTGANCSQLNYPLYNDDDDGIPLTPPAGTSIHDASIYVTGCTDDNDGNATFHGYLQLYNGDSEMGVEDGGPIPAGVYTGAFTVTAIYPVATPAEP